MDPVHLRPSELDHELSIRGIIGLGTSRRKTAVLRDYLKREAQGSEIAPSSSVHISTAEHELHTCAGILDDILALTTVDEGQRGYLYSDESKHRLMHVGGRINRIHPICEEHEEMIVDLRNRVAELLTAINARNPIAEEGSTAVEAHARRSRQSFRLVDEPLLVNLNSGNGTNRMDSERVISQINVGRDSLHSDVSTGLPQFSATTTRMRTPDGFENRSQWPPEETMFRARVVGEDRDEEGAVGGANLNAQASTCRPSGPIRATQQSSSLQKGAAQSCKGKAPFRTVFVQSELASDQRAVGKDSWLGLHSLGTGRCGTRMGEQSKRQPRDEYIYGSLTEPMRVEQETRLPTSRRDAEQEDNELYHRFQTSRAPRETYTNRNWAEAESDQNFERERQRYPNVEFGRQGEIFRDDRVPIRQRAIRKSVPVN